MSGLDELGAVVLEMLRVSQTQRLSQTKSESEFQEAANWSKSGWPAYEIYQPLIQSVYRQNLIPGAASPTRSQLMAQTMGNGQESAFEPLRIDQHQQLSKDIERAHCGYLKAQMIELMTAVQVFKDRTMAHELRSQTGFKRGVLIAGNGHIRKDYGVPVHLSNTVAIGLLEVDDSKTKPSQYDVGLYDYVFFTERVDNVDPCEKFKAQLEKMRSKHEKKSKEKQE